MLLFITLSASILFPPISIFAAFNPLVGGRRRVGLCFAAGADLFAALGLNFGLWWIGIVLTGLFASRGANYVSDIIRKLQSLGKPKAE